MARRKKRRPLRPRVPSRVKKRTKKTSSHQQHELLGLALAAFGLVLAVILYLGLDGGAVGSWLADALTAVMGEAAYGLPLVLVAIGSLMLARSELLDVRPFRLGLGVGFLGLMTLLGKDNGGWIGLALGGALAGMIGDTGAAIVGGALLLAGALLVSGASTGAILRHTGHVVRTAGSGARKAFEWPSRESTTDELPVLPPAPEAPPTRLLDGAEAFPDVVGDAPSAEYARLLVADAEPEPELEFERSIESVLGASTEHAEYRLPGPGDPQALPGDACRQTATRLRARPTCSSARSPSSAWTRS